MKRSPRPSRPSANLSESIARQLNMYALAAGAAGVGLMALAQPAEAKIIYTNVGLTIGWNSNYPLDLNHDGKIDFIIHNTRFYVTSGGLSSLSIKGATGNKVQGNEGRFLFLAAALKRGVRVGNVQNTAESRFSSNARMAFSCTGGCTGGDVYDPGHWLNVANRYLGLQFKIHGKIHYGWARLSVSQVHYGFAHPFVALLTGYAYETIPNKPIITGKTKGPDDDSVEQPNDPGLGASLTNPIPDTPPPASLGMLALGAQGVPLYRRKEYGLATCGFTEQAQ